MRKISLVLPRRQLSAAIILALSVSLTACATQTQFTYQPPAIYQPPAQSVIIEKPQPILFKRLALMLQKASPNIIWQDEKTGRLRVPFKTDAENLIDCGLVSYDGKAFPAARAEQSFKYIPPNADDMQFQRFADAKVLGSTTGWALISALASSPKIYVYRTVELEGISFIELVPEGEDKTEVNVSAAYFVKRTWKGTDQDGHSSRPISEQISFNTGETGVFTDFTRCVCNYELERMVLEIISAIAAD